MATKTYRYSPDGPGEMLFPTLGVQVQPGDTFELPDDLAINSAWIEVKSGSKWNAAYVADPPLSAEQTAEIESASSWTEPASEPPAAHEVAPIDAGGDE